MPGQQFSEEVALIDHFTRAQGGSPFYGRKCMARSGLTLFSPLWSVFETPRLPGQSCLRRPWGLDTAAYCHVGRGIGGLPLSLIPLNWGPLLASAELPIFDR